MLIYHGGSQYNFTFLKSVGPQEFWPPMCPGLAGVARGQAGAQVGDLPQKIGRLP